MTNFAVDEYNRSTTYFSDFIKYSIVTSVDVEVRGVVIEGDAMVLDDCIRVKHEMSIRLL